MVKQSISNYRPFLSSLIVSFFFLILASCGGGGSSGGGSGGGDTSPPTVISPLSPVNNATDVGVNANVSATFSESVVPGSVVFLLNGPGGVVATPAPALNVSNDLVTITPNAALANNTTYVATISAARDVAGNNLAAPFNWSFTTAAAPDTTPPTVSSHIPSFSAIDVSADSTISIVFSEAMNPATITASNIIIVDNVMNVVTGTFSYSGVTAVFNPSALTVSTTYTVTVTTGVTDVATNPMTADYGFTFTTANVIAPDATPPTVSSTVPAINATGVSLNSAINATFSEALNPATISAATFLVETSGGAPVTVTGTVSYNGVTATFTPDSNLAGDTQFTATLTGGIADLAGVVLAAEYIWSFTTGPAPDTTPPTVESTVPADTATGIALNTTITALFSEAINPATINTTNFSVYDETNSVPVSGTVTYNGLTATFTPNSDLANGPLYRATLSGVTDIAGNPLALTTWTFAVVNTPDLTAPTIVLPTVPADTATSVDVTTSISAEFDEPMDAATLSTATFTVNDDTNMLAVSGVVIYDGTTAIFQPSAALASSATITVTIDGATDLAGNPLPVTTWTFTTSAMADTTGPQITSTTPVDLATDIGLRPTITIVFSEAIDCANLLDASLTSSPAATFTSTCSTNTAIFIPTADLARDQFYTVTLNPTVTDVAGNSLAVGAIPNPWTFRTVPELWTVQFGSASHDQARGVVTDSAGNVYITGSTLSSIDGKANAGGNDIFLVKYSPVGKRLWTRVTGTNKTDMANALAVDSLDNIYIAGYSRGDLKGNTNNNFTKDIAIIKYNTTGVRQWTRLLGTGFDDFASAITVDASNNIYVTGTTFGDFDGASATRFGSEFFLVKLDSINGDVTWKTQLGGDSVGSNVTVRGVTTVGANVYTTGYFTISIGALQTTRGTDIFLARFSASNLTLNLTKIYGTNSDDLAHGITTDGTNLYFVGNTRAGLNGETVIGNIDAFLMKTDLDGAAIWTRIFGTSGDDLGRGITIDTGGNIFVTGYTNGSFAGSSNAGNNDLFVTKYDTSGTTVWSPPVVRQLGSAADDTARAITTYTSMGVTDVFVVGETLGALDGNVSFGLSDFFAVNYDGASGTKN